MFKKYDQNQQFLLPLRLESFIPEDHIARILNDVIESVDITAIECKEGDQVALFNCQEMIEEIADKTGTISYEVITAISQRVKRLISS